MARRNPVGASVTYSELEYFKQNTPTAHIYNLAKPIAVLDKFVTVATNRPANCGHASSDCGSTAFVIGI